MTDTEEGLTFEDVEQWRNWLERHHDTADHAWLRIAKKGSAARTVTNAEALEVALCYGWIDGKGKSLDADHYLQRYSPRRPGSSWSLINTRKVEGLIAAGRMRPAGMAQVRMAKEDGRWEAAYPPPSEMTVPDDVTEALRSRPGASEAFSALNGGSRYTMLLGVFTARTPKGRAARIARLVDALAPKDPGR